VPPTVPPGLLLDTKVPTPLTPPASGPNRELSPTPFDDVDTKVPPPVPLVEETKPGPVDTNPGPVLVDTKPGPLLVTNVVAPPASGPKRLSSPTPFDVETKVPPPPPPVPLDDTKVLPPLPVDAKLLRLSRPTPGMIGCGKII
jgi:hypothetical protein